MPVHSSFQELNEAIKNENPFDGRYVVKSQQIWGEEFPDTAELNTHASNAVLESVARIYEGHLSTFGITFLAEKGIGKSHVLSRIRHHLQSKSEGVFIYMCEYGNLSHIKSQFLQGLASSLRKRGKHGVMQAQELATHLLNQASQKNFLAQQLVSQFHQVLAKNPQIIDQLTAKILSLNPSIEDPHIVRALIWTLSAVHAPFAMSWLAGRELTQTQADVMGLPNPIKEDRDSETFRIACQILDLISHYSVPVICFDELDGTEYGDEDEMTISGFTRAQVVCSLAKDLYNNLNRGVIVTAMYPRTWSTQIRALPQSEAITDRIAQKTIEFTHLKPDDSIKLVSGWLEDFYARQGLTPPHQVYPFDEKQLREIGDGATIREILRWCADNFGSRINISERIERVYREVEEGLEDFFEDNEKIANALAFGLEYLKGQTVENVTIEAIDRDVFPKGENRGFIKFRILGNEDGRAVKIGVSVLQDAHGKTVGAGLRRLIQYQTFDLTRGCLLRSKSIHHSWSANDELQKLLGQMGGEWAPLNEADIKPLIALRSLSRELDSYGFQREHFYQFIEQNRLIVDNALIHEILSDPSGQSPDNVVDEDAVVEALNLAVVSEVEDISGLDAIQNIDHGVEAVPEINTAALSKTQLATFELHQQGMSISEIVENRSLSHSTIVRHFVDLVEMHQPINLDQLVPQERQVAIRDAIEKTTDTSSLRNIREHLGDSYTYDEIQIIRAKWLLEQQLSVA